MDPRAETTFFWLIYVHFAILTAPAMAALAIHLWREHTKKSWRNAMPLLRLGENVPIRSAEPTDMPKAA